MPYGYIALFAGLGLAAWFVFATRAPRLAKAAAAGILAFCLAAFAGWIACHPLIPLFLLAALCVSIILYRTWQQARKRHQD